MSDTTKFWDKIADKYAARPVADEAAYQRKLEITRRYFRPDTRVFEFGCGTGSTAIAHAPHVAQFHATDISAKMIEIAQGKADAAGIDNIHFERAALEELELTAGSFDVVLGLSILHLLEDYPAAIAKSFALLKPGGLFVSSTACIGDSMPLFGLVAPIGRWFGLFPYVNIFKEADLALALETTGFNIEHRSQSGKRAAVFIVARKPD